MKSKFFYTAIILSALILPATSATGNKKIANGSSNYNNPGKVLLSAQMIDTLKEDTKEAMIWLYENMAYPDLFSHSPEFYLKNVEASLSAKDEMPWGSIVPDREWYHFVLPLRVNNEYLDSCRSFFFEEIKERVKDLSMEEAILEVNHWSHEKASYQPSDGRTSAPLSTISQSTGRCGEESTLLTAALRAVGIPARQIYTPRWAHTDDNHAWVEAWANGKWYFLGACEPAPILNMAWFNAPASRGLLMHTDVIGNYQGPEEIIRKIPLTTTINVTPNYTETGLIDVIVKDIEGNPVPYASVDFCIYNYAEFYPAVKRVANCEGRASLLCGKGDMTVWASDGKNYGFKLLHPEEGGEPVEIILDKAPADNYNFDLEIIPPAESVTLPSPSQELIDLNTIRLSYEDSLRNISSKIRFVSAEESDKYAMSMQIDPTLLAKIMRKARGNGRNLISYLKVKPLEQRNQILMLLDTLPEKDVRDITVDVIDDCLPYITLNSSDFEYSYIISPRISLEHLIPYKKNLSTRIPKKDKKRWKKNPQLAAEWTAKHIILDDTGNPKRLMMTPVSVLEAGRADSFSREIFCVAALRSAGIPARIDPVTSKPQYGQLENGKEIWTDLRLDSFGSKKKNADDAKYDLTILYSDTTSRLIPQYYLQFTLSNISDGKLQLLEFPDDLALHGGKITLPVESGKYLLLSGTRLAGGEVLAHGEVFDVGEGKPNVCELKLRHDPTRLSVIGSLNAENIYYNVDNKSERSILSTTGRGYYALLLAKPNDEPTTHILNDIRNLAADFEKANMPVVILFANEDEYKRFDRNQFEGLPMTVTFGIDTDGVSFKELKESLNLETEERPLLVLADTFNRVVFAVQGYTIGAPRKLLR